MSKGKIIVFSILAVLIIGVVWVISAYSKAYNQLIQLDEAVKNQWGQVENQFQRRADLIPNLVNTVKGYANFEQNTLTNVVEARAKAYQTQVNINDAQSFATFQKNQGELSSALSRLMMVTEQYPDLKANQNFLDLQSQLEGTENRITHERRLYNDVVKNYNIEIKGFFMRFIAASMGLSERPYFTATDAAQTAPTVQF